MIVILFLLIIISLGPVNALEDSANDIVLGDNAICDEILTDENIDDEVLSVGEDINEEVLSVDEGIDEEILSDGNRDMGNFTDLERDINSATGNYYALTRDYTYNNDTDHSYQTGIAINQQNFVLDGNDHTLNGNNLAQVFYLFETNNITLMNINFINANSSCFDPAYDYYYRGGAIDIENRPVTVINCTFKNCYSSTGGAIFDYGHSPIENCTFIDNYASQGGAIYGNPDINNCTFINNTARYGGALLLTRHCYLNNSAFYNNTATEGGGGAISGSAFKFENSIFEGNKAKGNGGAMALSDNWFTLEVNNCTFKNNIANFDGSYEYSYGGGAIFTSDNKVLVQDSKFVNNTGSSGGALYIWTAGTIKNSTFEDNNAESGGAILMGVGEVSGCAFTNNNASQTGGAIHGGSWNFTVSSSAFENNNAADGGAMYIIKGNISDSQFFNNSATGNGGAAFVNNSDVYGCLFIGNNATNGGALYLTNCSLNGSQFTNNSATEKGGAVFVNNSDVYGCQFSYNNASDGGAVYLTNGTLNESQFFNNTAVNGAALYAVEGAVYNSQFEDNVADETGGAITVENELDLTNVDFYHNIADGVISDYSLGPDADIKITLDSVLDASDASYIINYGGDYSVYLKDYHGVPIYDSIVSFVFNGEHLANVTTDYDGFAKITFTPEILEAVAAGAKDLVISYEGTDYLNPVTKTVVININKDNLDIVANAASYVINHGGDYSVTVKDSGGNPFVGKIITFVLNGKNIGTATTDASGVAKIKLTPNILKAATAGTRNLVVSYAGDEILTPVTKTVAIKINKENIKFVAKNVKYIINYGKYYSVTVKDSKGNVVAGKKVSFVLKGKKIGTVTTNAKGIARIKLTAKTLKKAKAGTKKLVIKFSGDSFYNAFSKTVKVTIKKEKTKIVAKKKTFKRALKTKKYSIKLKNSKGKVLKKTRVYLKVKGKTFKAKTNRKGKATFKIKNLKKKGKFRAKITFKGTKYYLKSTKKVYLRIK